jgi:hypothetical protein
VKVLTCLSITFTQYLFLELVLVGQKAKVCVSRDCSEMLRTRHLFLLPIPVLKVNGSLSFYPQSSCLTKKKCMYEIGRAHV